MFNITDKKNIETIDYKNFINSKSIKHSDEANDYLSGLKFLIQSEADIVTYNRIDKLLLFNVAVLNIDKDGNYFYDYPINRNYDIIDNISFNSTNKNIKMTYTLSKLEYDILNEFISISAPYNEFLLRFTFTEKPSIDDIIEIKYRNYLINSKDRELLSKNMVVTDTHKYSDGGMHCSLYI